MKTTRHSKVGWMNLSVIAAAALLSAGCIQEDVDAPNFRAQQGEEAPGTAAPYASGPYGFEVGSIIPNLEFLGYPNYVGLGAEMRITKLSDFYNPTGTEVFDEDHSHYGVGTAKPKAFVMLISSVWCGPCRQEASGLPAEYAHWKPLGGDFLAVLIDGPDPGTPATVSDLTQWSDEFQPPYSMTMDPSSDIMAFYEPAFPGNIIIRTSDMKIIRREAGVPRSDFWTTFQQVLDGTEPGGFIE